MSISSDFKNRTYLNNKLTADREAGLTKSEILKGFRVSPTSGKQVCGYPQTCLPDLSTPVYNFSYTRKKVIARKWRERLK
jgi:hypothetical protein